VSKPTISLALFAAFIALAVGASWRVDRGPTVRALQLETPVLADGRVRLQWRGSPDAVRYLVEVLAPDHVPRFAGNAEAPALNLPPDVSNEIMRGQSLLWRVTAFGADGDTRAASSLSPLVVPSR
jgi:hypothetical protein